MSLWVGKKGLGSGKRALSPGAKERIAKVAKVDEEVNKETYRSRAREDYEERRAEGRLLSATRTLQELDEKGGVQVSPSFVHYHHLNWLLCLHSVLVATSSMCSPSIPMTWTPSHLSCSKS